MTRKGVFGVSENVVPFKNSGSWVTFVEIFKLNPPLNL